ncbi:MAG: L-threonylcarbamoyladenylate synthase [Thermodesulfovibrio sp.]|nr:L-threonylcarbamoyladenylate synthase [Thermodesulfovibrio sp.]MCX7723956.1 L-threonylcarbamoyladenylate synthase [Thermodesulfovibrio sp.]MDW7972145.1 L-threonylcarbamoyladenylate synthase [Thermodesulfovibrio sp.]
MKVVKAEEIDIVEVLKILENGGVIIYPTETLYGIGVKYDNKKALKRVFDIKKRPEEKSFPLIVNLQHLELIVDFIPSLAKKFMEKYWPGPLTLLLPAKKNLSKRITKDNKVAVRMPGESFALKLIQASKFPITATSANISGYPASDCIEDAIKYFKDSDIDLLIDGGKLPGIPSTIVDVTVEPPKIIRKGAIEIDLSLY